MGWIYFVVIIAAIALLRYPPTWYLYGWIIILFCLFSAISEATNHNVWTAVGFGLGVLVAYNVMIFGAYWAENSDFD